jgi:hypothetical protein
MLTSQPAAPTGTPGRAAAGTAGLESPARQARPALWPSLRRLDRQALVHQGAAETAAWQAFFAGADMTWLEVQA